MTDQFPTDDPQRFSELRPGAQWIVMTMMAEKAMNRVRPIANAPDPLADVVLKAYEVKAIAHVLSAMNGIITETAGANWVGDIAAAIEAKHAPGTLH